MKTLEGKTAVVTGAASGIGLGMTEAFANRGMKVVMADMEEDVLLKEADRLQKSNFDVTPCVVDVRSQDAIEDLLKVVEDTCEKAHVLCNNAGVSGAGTGSIWEASQKDWDWVMGVNFHGVVNGMRAFIPHMLAHGEEGHIVNTSSILGLTTGGGSVYSVTKHAVARLTEGLFQDLRNSDARIGVTLLCPGLIATNIVRSVRNKPADLLEDADQDAERKARIEQMSKYFEEEGMPPRDVGEMVADAILQNQFYLLTHPENLQGARRRFDDILNLRNPSPLPPGLLAPVRD